MVNIILFIVYHTHKKREQRFWAGKRAAISRHKNKGSIECILLWSIYSDQMSSRSVKRLILGLLRLLCVEGRNKETILHEMRESVQYKDFWYIMRKKGKRQVPLDFGNGLPYAVLDYYGLHRIPPPLPPFIGWSFKQRWNGVLRWGLWEAIRARWECGDGALMMGFTKSILPHPIPECTHQRKTRWGNSQSDLP